MTLTFMHAVGALAVIALMVTVGVVSGKKVSSATDFESGGGSMTARLVGGSIMGTLVGGSSTIGTAQLAFTFGLSAWWFTLGAGLGCLVFGLFMVKPIRSYGCPSVQQIVRHEFGNLTGLVTCIAVALSCIFTVASQLLAANVLIESVTGLRAATCIIISVALMAAYVGFGGIRGTGTLGAIKLVLLYILVFVTGFLALRLGGGLSGIYSKLPHDQYFNLLARGTGKDLGAGLSVVFGVLSSQAYIQPAMAARSHKDAKGGAFLSALFIPPIGIGGVFVGYYMRLQFPDLVAGQALPRFILEFLPPLAAGAFLGILLFTLVGTGAGVALSFSSVITTDIYKSFMNGKAGEKKLLFLQRASVITVLTLSGILAFLNQGSPILSWGVMSMGLRGVVLLIPLVVAMFLPSKIPKQAILMASLLGLAVMLWGIAAAISIDPLLPGIAVGITISLGGLLYKQLADKHAKKASSQSIPPPD